MKITTIQQANEALLPYVPLVSQLTGKDTVLDRILPLMELLGNPQNTINVVHIAGTSGKTSTAYYTAALLKATGKKVGLTVSPHIDSVTERVQIDGSPIDDDLFCAELTEFLKLISGVELPPSYFELLYAFAIWVFARQSVDYAVIETGMGGLYDATNVVTRADKVCVLTDIGFDHTHLLGDTLPEIAAQKVGIVHNGNVVLTYQQAPEVMGVYREWLKRHQAELICVDDQITVSMQKTMPHYQQRNWNLAYHVYLYLLNRDNLESLTGQVLTETQSIQVPGRMDVWHLNGKTVVMDGAHNVQKMTAFLESFQQLYPDMKPTVLLALKHGKEYQAVASIIARLTDRVIVTTFATSQDLPVESLDPPVLERSLKEAGVTDTLIIENHDAAFRQLLADKGEIVIIIGSFYLLSQIRNNQNI